jgi:hypothetical protein
MISEIIRYLLSNFTLTFFVIGLLCSVLKIYRHRQPITNAFVAESFISYFCLWSLGISYIYNAVMHIAFHQMAAHFIGWADSPFQLEVGFASLGMGIVGILSFRKNFGLRLGLIIMSSVFLWGAAAGHLYQISTTHNYAPGNAGVMLWTGLLQPVVSLVLLAFSYRFRNSKEKSTSTQKEFTQISFTK